MSFSKNKRQETIVYLVLWGMLFIAPVLSLLIRNSNTGESFDWNEVLMIWREFAVFLIVFLLHNHLLAPQLVYKQRKLVYFSCVAALTGAFLLFQCSQRPDESMRRHRPDMADHRPPMHHEQERFGDFDDHMPPPDDFDDHDSTAVAKTGEHPMHHPQEMDKKHPPMFMGQHDIVSMIVLILMLGMNLGVKLYFKQRSDQKQMAELEKEKLEQQLEYLKYQINPHFLMNTLNNIHALVDIDSERAKSTIVVLSKMMRFILYEGNRSLVPVAHEIDFLQEYIELMKMRYTDKVKINVSIPELKTDAPAERSSLPSYFQKPTTGQEAEQTANKSGMVPPLILIIFVENAFKHGVSYKQESVIDIRIELSSHLRFTCHNRKIPASEDRHGGIGLQNVKKRLDLIYGKNYSLNIDDAASTYNIELILPL